MKKKKLASLILGTALMSGSVALAEGTSGACGAGKCGSCGSKAKKEEVKDKNTTDAKKEKKSIDMKCGSGKCGGSK